MTTTTHDDFDFQQEMRGHFADEKRDMQALDFRDEFARSNAFTIMSRLLASFLAEDRLLPLCSHAERLQLVDQMRTALLGPAPGAALGKARPGRHGCGPRR